MKEPAISDRSTHFSQSLRAWGWNEAWDQEWSQVSSKDPAQPARVLVEQRDYLEVMTAQGPARAELKGRLRKRGIDLRPTVGDWVVLDSSGQIDGVLPRKTCLRRKAAGETEEIQVMAANIDWVFIATSLNKDFNPRRLERFLVAARDSQARVALVFTKSDLELLDVEDAKALLKDRLHDIEVIATSSRTGLGLDRLRALIRPGESAVFLGTSGVGKSSLVNALLKSDIQEVGEARIDDDKGRHTTTGRHSFQIPGGGIVIDSPGIRELQLADESVRIDEEFEEIEELALRCKFTNCRHEGEKGCAVRAAVEAGTLTADRLASYKKLKSELSGGRRR